MIKNNALPMRVALPYKDAWLETQDFLRRWWAGEPSGRPAIAVTAPAQWRRPVPQPPDSQTRWTDPDFVIRETRAMYENTYFAGEAIPARTLVVGYAVFGGEPKFDHRTVWHTPTIHDWTTPLPRYDWNNPWWLRAKEIVSVLAD